MFELGETRGQMNGSIQEMIRHMSVKAREVRDKDVSRKSSDLWLKP